MTSNAAQRDWIADVCKECGGRIYRGNLCSYECPLDNTNPHGRSERVTYVPEAEVDRWKQQSWEDQQEIMRLREALEEIADDDLTAPSALTARSALDQEQT